MVSSPSGETSSGLSTVTERDVRLLINCWHPQKLQELKQVLAESPTDSVLPEAKTSKTSI
jgi:hypothetical protein